MNSIEMRRKRANLWEQAKGLHERALAENRDLSADEREQWDRIMADMDGLKAQIDREERLASVGAELDRREAPIVGRADGQGGGLADGQEYRKAFWNYVRYGVQDLEPEQRAALRSGYATLAPELRALATGIATAGGYTIADEDMRGIVDAMKGYGGMREVATIVTTSTGGDLPIPSSDDTGNKGVRVAENTEVSEQDITFGQRVLRAYTYSSKMIKVPFQLLQDTSFDLEGWLREKLAVRIARITNEEFTTGSGAAMPEGVVTGATSAATTAAADAVTYAELVTLEHSVNRDYRRNGRWMFADATLKVLKQMVDAQNRPLWVPGVAMREPDTILSYPYTVNDDVAAIAAGAKAILFGDFRNYYIRDVRGMLLLRLTERYAEYGQVAFLAFTRHDGLLVDAGQHPVKYLTQHA